MALHEGEKLREQMKDLKLTQDSIAGMLGMTRQNLNHHLRKEKLDEDFVRLIREKMGFTSLSNGFALSVDRLENAKNIFKENEGTPVYELAATATQTEYASQLPEVPSFHVKIPGYEDCNFGMHVYGHSMYPTIETGSLILCRKVKDKSIIMYGEIYLIRTEDYLMVKRLQKNSQKGYVLCTSDNFEKRSEEFKRFEPFDMAIDKIIDLYLVKGIIKKTQS